MCAEETGCQSVRNGNGLRTLRSEQLVHVKWKGKWRKMGLERWIVVSSCPED